MPNPIPELTAKQIARFWSRVDVRGPDDCWLWTANRHPYGYGVFSIGKGPLRSSRVALALDGRNPLGRYALHACDNPPCCNPKHLFVGDSLDNMRDMAKKGRDFKIRGEQVTKSKLTNEDVRAIRASGELGKAVAARYGVSQATISRVRLRQCWKHIT